MLKPNANDPKFKDLKKSNRHSSFKNNKNRHLKSAQNDKKQQTQKILVVDKNDTSDHESQLSIDTNDVKQNLDFTSEKETPTRQLSPIIESENENEPRDEEEDSSNSPPEQEAPVEEEESDEHSDSTDMEPHYTRDSEFGLFGNLIFRKK